MIGNHPETGEPVTVRMGRYGPVAQIGEARDGEKPRFAGLSKNQLLETITLNDALNLFRLPRSLGEYEGEEVIIGIGKFKKGEKPAKAIFRGISWGLNRTVQKRVGKNIFRDYTSFEEDIECDSLSTKEERLIHHRRGTCFSTDNELDPRRIKAKKNQLESMGKEGDPSDQLFFKLYANLSKDQ